MKPIEIHQELFNAGHMIVGKKKDDRWVWGITQAGENEPDKWYEPYDLVMEVAAEFLRKITKPKDAGFSVLVLYNRGLGRESFSLDPVVDCSLAGAKEKAQRKAEEYISKTAGFEKAKIIEVCIRPVTLV